ncbi:flagella basal body P-ring formation protein FlgA [Sphingorhabdus sp.]|uniref:flagella basal body P-ring formation protein FlgA n=1 Tax=Sphingorhabdus sp. TaxID=1902408 RepID=UPI003919256F
MLSLLMLFAATSAQFENLEILDQNIQLHANAEPLDKRLKLARCPENPIIAPVVGDAVIVRCPAIGWRLRVPVRAAGATDKVAHIIIRKGDMVECITSGPGFAVSTQMIALDDAAAGQSFRVKSLTSPTPMTAVAKARGLATF